MLTESLGRPELYRRRDHGEVGGSAETKRAVRAVLGSSRVLGCTGRRAMSLRSKTRGQLGPIRTGGEQSRRRAERTWKTSGRNSGEVGPDVGDGSLGGVPGAQANLLRWLGLAAERRSTAGTAAQGLCAAMA